jgi:stage III sporulation protein AB
MSIIKNILLFCIFIISVRLGQIFSRKYVSRLEELRDIKSMLNMMVSKIKFTYEPLSQIFEELSNNLNSNISKILINAKNNMKNDTAENSWNKAVEETNTNLNNEDKKVLKMLSKLLGQTDIDGQLSQIKITQNFIDKQIESALEERRKNEKLYRNLGITIGLTIVIILF